MKIDPDGTMKPTNKAISITVGQVQKFNYNGKYDRILGFEKTVQTTDPKTKKTVFDITKLPKPTFTAGTCDNFPLEVHL